MDPLLLFLAHQNARRRPGRDRDAFAAIAKALVATAEFAEVAFRAPSEGARVGADRTPLAIVSPAEWQEQPDSAAGAVLRRVAYSLTLIVRRHDPFERFEAIERLSGIAQSVLEGAALGGFCLADMSRVHRGRYDEASRHPELRMTLQGEFGYAIASSQDRNLAR